MPQASTAMRTWPRPASGMGFSTSLKGIPGLVISTALIVLAMWSHLLWSWTCSMPLTRGRSPVADRCRRSGAPQDEVQVGTPGFDAVEASPGVSGRGGGRIAVRIGARLEEERIGEWPAHH